MALTFDCRIPTSDELALDELDCQCRLSDGYDNVVSKIERAIIGGSSTHHLRPRLQACTLLETVPVTVSASGILRMKFGLIRTLDVMLVVR